jgi:hypothetical protein
MIFSGQSMRNFRHDDKSFDGLFCRKSVSEIHLQSAPCTLGQMHSEGALTFFCTYFLQDLYGKEQNCS